jgi:hypothetical protein
MCERQYSKKYTTRDSPPYPANKCPPSSSIGNDGTLWTNMPNKNGVWRWVRAKTVTLEQVKTIPKHMIKKQSAIGNSTSITKTRKSSRKQSRTPSRKPSRKPNRKPSRKRKSSRKSKMGTRI